MNKKYNLKLDLQFRCNNSTMKFNQFDNNTSDFFIRITNGGKLFDIEKAIVVLATIKPSGKVASQFVEIENDLVYADLKPNMKDEIGTYTAQAMLILEDERVVTDVISYEVEEDKIFSLLNDSAEDTEEFTLLTDMLSRLSAIEISEEQRMINEAERILSEENRKIEEAKRVEAELIRQHEEADRAKYDATRESNENIRKQNESIRLANETNRIDEEAKRVEEENKRKLAEEERNANYNFMTEDEERRRIEANAHKEAEVLRVQAETNRVNEEAKRRTTEQARVSAENTRVSNENTRKSNEIFRENNETQRIEAETQRQSRYNSFIVEAEANANDFENYTNTAKAKEEERKANELDRKSQEDRRVSNEAERISNENTRKANENARIESEKQRVDAENLRKEKIIEIQSDYDSLKKVIIDENASANLQNQINQTNSQLEHKASKNEVFSMANMGQDIKEAMTGGSVAVTGAYSVDTPNLIENSVTKNKSEFINTNVVNLINIAKSEVTNINYSTGVKPNYICDDTSIISNVDDESNWLFFYIPLTLTQGKTYTCKARKNNLNKKMNLGISYTDNPENGNIHSFGLNNDIYTLTFTCDSETNYLRIHGLNGCVDLRDIILYEGTDDVVWSLDREVHITDVDDGIITYNKLSDDIKNLFYCFEDILNLNGAEYLTGNNVNSYKINASNFNVSFTEGSSYFIFKGQQFKAGHKYIITYKVVGDVDYRFGLRNSKVNTPSWQKNIFESNSQTSGAYTMGSVVYYCEADGCLGFNNSCSLAVSYNASIRIFDVTDCTDEEINKIDFLSLGVSNVLVKNISSGSTSNSNNLENKKILVYGDSISQNGYFQNMIKNYFNCNVVTNAIGGTTIGYCGSTSFSADERISQLPSDVDYVMIMGGTNDWNRVKIGELDFASDTIDRTNLKGGLLYTIKGIQSQCPNATIIVCTAIGGRGKNADSTHLYPLMDQYNQSTLDIRNAEIEVANIANVDVCDTWSCGINGFNRTKYIADTVHPNTDGYILLSNYMINYLKKYM